MSTPTLERSLGPSFKPRYDQVVALVVYWENGDDVFKHDAKVITGFLGREFRFDTFHFGLPSTGYRGNLMRRIEKLIQDYHKGSTLIIFYYSGHGSGSGGIARWCE